MKTIGKIQILLTLAISAMIFLSSCNKFEGEGGNIITVAPVDSFISIDISIPCNINLGYDTTKELTIEAQENIQYNIATRVENQILYIDFVQKPHNYNPITLTFKMPDFRNVTIRDNNTLTVTSPFATDSRVRFEVWGEGDVIFTDTIKCYEFLFKSSGDASLQIAYLESQNFKYTVIGNANAIVAGTSKDSKLTIDGSSEFHGFNLFTRNTILDVSGLSDITELNATNRLETRVTGSATVIYKGNPTTVDNSASTGNLNISASE